MARSDARILLSALLASLALVGCKPAATGADAAASAAMATPATPATIPTPATISIPTPASTATSGDAGATDASADFDPASVPESTATLPPFPFFKAPDGLASVQDEKTRNSSFDREHMIAGGKVVALEGKVFRDLFPLDNPDRPYSALEFQRNYENAITDLGGMKVSAVQFTDEVNNAFGGRDAVDAHFHGTCAGVDCENNTYLIRQGGQEYWVLVSTGAIPLHGAIVVLQRKAMESKLGFLDAGAMKKAIDKDGHVALHINFDVDKATLRPDAKPVVAEIDKLLGADPALKLSIEGHTDNTGTAAHNQELSAARAASVRDALVALGVDASRLTSKGFGQDKPVADNGTESGRAQNRRVELVKVD
ncbi:OmpA family protein [Pseudoluteimonas lycopersici]|uniref:OmpA family protein n=1 Tax=Pseudoluteimonas lycopersici TaxID=1324796 RepID=A0A516V5L3_9GAMM|nr:OmpA family protein [Lysobacter lycopersici]QDQ73814.1 OmpA family protein [Lysobacter lycopersici]